MSTIDPLTMADFPLKAVGQYVYRRTSSSPLIGPMSMELAVDLAARLNRDEANQQALSMGIGSSGPSNRVVVAVSGGDGGPANAQRSGSTK